MKTIVALVDFSDVAANVLRQAQSLAQAFKSHVSVDAMNRRTEAVAEQNGQRLRVMKGAVRTVAEDAHGKSASPPLSSYR